MRLRSGTVTYRRSAPAGLAQLTWWDRSGKLIRHVGAPGPDIRIWISPDGRFALADQWGARGFDAPIAFVPVEASPARSADFYEKSGVRLASDGTVPNKRYAVRQIGIVEVGNLSCGQCHTRVMPDGSVLKGAQGFFRRVLFCGKHEARAQVRAP